MASPDKETSFSEAQALTVTAVSSNVVKMRGARSIGPGEAMCVAVVPRVKPDEANANETYVIELQADDNEGMSSATVIGSKTMLRTAKAGELHVIPIPPDVNNESFLRLNYTLGGTTPSVTIDAWLTPQSMLPVDKYVPKGYVVA